MTNNTVACLRFDQPVPRFGTRWAPLLGCLVVFFLTALPAAAQPSSTNCVLLAVQGKVDVLPADATTWITATNNQELTVGTMLRTGPRSRATVRLSDLSVIRVNELTTFEIRAAQPVGTTRLDFKQGTAYFFNRTRPMDSRFSTPLVTGAIRGTEFGLDVAADGHTTVTLIDGEVVLKNEQGEVTLNHGEQGIVEPGQAPRKTAVLEAINIIQWNLYYPAVLNPADLDWSAATREELATSLEKYRTGDLLGALAAYPANHQPESDAERTFYAALLLAAGQVAPAEATIKEVSPATSLTAALHDLIAIVKNQPRPEHSASRTATEFMVASYCWQAKSKLDDALSAAQSAATLAPEFGFAWVRVAELEFSFGRIAAAKAALAKGLQLSPRHAQGLALQGFLHAAENETREALAAFDQAIAMDSSLGNAWLGRGLCRIRSGQVTEGRKDLQVAATLEPNRADLRSYLGKAWFEARDAARADKELKLAQRLDPNDPTPWLYSGLMAQQQNRVNEAVADLERAKTLNDNRSVYRSQLLLDQDRAVRGVNLAKIYQDAGMDEVSAREAARSVDYDYANYSAHLFLANSYDALRDPKQINLRYETPWFSELLVANLLAPVGAGSLSQNVSQQEYSRLFAGDRLGFSAGTEYLSGGDWAQTASQFGTLGNFGYALDGMYRSQNGDRFNNDLEVFGFTGTFKQQLSPRDSALLLVQTMHLKSGDLRQYYDQTGLTPGMPAPSTTLRVKETQEPNLFAGYHHEWQPGVHTLVLAGRLQDSFEATDPGARFIVTTKNGAGVITAVGAAPGTLAYESDLEAYTAEVQQIFQSDNNTLVLGGRYQSGELDTHSLLTRNLTVNQLTSPTLERASAYVYDSYQLLEMLQLTAGASYDFLEYPLNNDIPPVTAGEASKNQFSPKAGFRLTPREDTTIRGVYTRSLGGVFYDTSVRLEPTQIAGFNQVFRSVLPESEAGLVPGSRFETFGLALDQNFKTRTYVSVAGELLKSRGARVVGTLDAFGPALLDIPSGVAQTLDYEEASVTLTANQLLGQHFALGGSYRYSVADLSDRVPAIPLAASGNFSATANRDVQAILNQVRAYLLFNHRCGFFSSVESVWTAQSSSGYATVLPDEDIWQFNAFVGYRFPRRHAEFRLGLLNIGDQDYKLNPLNLYAELPRSRTLSVGFKLSF